MSTFLVYTSPAAGHVFPLVPGVLELGRRGHRVHVVTDPDLVSTLTAAGLSASALDERVMQVRVADHQLPDGRNRLRLGLAQLMARGPFERDDLAEHIDTLDPDAILVDTLAYGAAVGAEAARRPWATTLPSLLPLPDRGIPPYGLGMRPRHDPLGRLRDRIVWRAVERAYGKAMLPPLNALRTGAGLAPLSSPFENFLAADLQLVLTGAPLEYPRATLPRSVRMVGTQIWDPPAASPAWLDEPGDPWVLVTCSTDYQADEALARTTLDALTGERVRVVVTLADAYDAFDHPVPANARLERFVPHAAILERCVAVVCPGGMGIAAKAVHHGVPVVAVPFGRDQPEVARRLVEAGCGVTVDRRKLTPAVIGDALRRARQLPRRAVDHDTAATAAGRFADAAEELTVRQPAPA